jgi:hypothetical protein
MPMMIHNGWCSGQHRSREVESGDFEGAFCSGRWVGSSHVLRATRLIPGQARSGRLLFRACWSLRSLLENVCWWMGDVGCRPWGGVRPGHCGIDAQSCAAPMHCGRGWLVGVAVRACFALECLEALALLEIRLRAHFVPGWSWRMDGRADTSLCVANQACLGRDDCQGFQGLSLRRGVGADVGGGRQGRQAGQE